MANRIDSLTSWNSDWADLRVAVLGLGVTGFAVADTLTELAAEVMVLASDADEQRASLVPVIGATLLTHDLRTVPQELVDFVPELLVVSPGFQPNHVVVEWAEAHGVAVWGDIELAWRVRDKGGHPADWILVTGTNGKTTTVQLTAEMLRRGGKRVAPCGNIGVPVLDAVRDPQGFDVFVVELSSYQLHYLKASSEARVNPPLAAVTPWASVCLNIADDHLDWHGSLAAYTQAKAFVYNNTRVACVYNKSDRETEDMVRNAEVVDGARAIGFDLGVPGPSELGLVDGILCDRAFLDDRANTALELITLGELESRGLASPHIVSNILAASGLARSYGVSPANVKAALLEFELDAHRIQHIVTARGVRWINDSKATNAHAADASLAAFSSVVWIVGGLFKGADVSDLVERHSSRLRSVVVIGKDRDEIREALRRHAPGVPVDEVLSDDTEEVMLDAVEFASRHSRHGDVVLLAPAAASMDQFANYQERGRYFAEAVIARWGGEADERPTDHRSG